MDELKNFFNSRVDQEVISHMISILYQYDFQADWKITFRKYHLIWHQTLRTDIHKKYMIDRMEDYYLELVSQTVCNLPSDFSNQAMSRSWINLSLPKDIQ